MKFKIVDSNMGFRFCVFLADPQNITSFDRALLGYQKDLNSVTLCFMFINFSIP